MFVENIAIDTAYHRKVRNSPQHTCHKVRRGVASSSSTFLRFYHVLRLPPVHSSRRHAAQYNGAGQRHDGKVGRWIVRPMEPRESCTRWLPTHFDEP